MYANTLLSLTSFALPNGVSDFELKDINNDGSLDVLFSESVVIIDVGTEKQTWFYNDGVGEFTYGGTTYNLNCSIYSEYLGQLMCVADFTGDGLLDMVVQPNFDGLVLLANNGNGSFLTPIVISEIFGWYGAQAVDIDSDGDLDLIYYTESSLFGHTYWHANDGLGGFSTPTLLFNFASQINIAYINNDNYPDLVVGDENMYWVANLGGGNFGPMQFIDSGLSDRKTADLNGDGNIDIIGRNLTGETVWLAGNGTGNFASPIELPTITNTIVALEDLDIDGDIDIVTSSNSQLNWHHVFA